MAHGFRQGDLEAGKDSVFSLMYLRILEDDPRKVQDLKAIDEPSGKNVLAYALSKGYKRIAANIIESGNAELGHADKSRDTPLHELMKTTDVALVKRIFEKYPQAARKGMLAQNRSGWTPLDLLHYHHKPESEMAKAVAAALDLPPNADRKTKIVRFRRLLDAIADNDSNLVVELIKEDKTLVNLVDDQGSPPLNYAGANSSLAAVHVLLAYGADPLGNAQTTFAPVEWALANKRPDVLRAMKIVGVTLKDRVRAVALPGEVGAMKTVAEMIKEYDQDNEFQQIFK